MLWTAALFLAIVLGTLAVFLWQDLRRRRSAMEQIRSRLSAKPRHAEKPAKLLTGSQAPGQAPLTSRLLERFAVRPRLQEWLETAGLCWHPARLAQLCAGAFVAATLASWPFLPYSWRPVSLLPGTAAAALPLLWVRRTAKARLRRFEEQFPECLEFVSRSMRAGHAFAVSLDMLSTEFQEPLAGEFRRTFDEHNLGLPLETALEKLTRRVPLLDLQFFVSAVLLQKRTGGNLAEVLDKLAGIIRERFKLRGRIRAVSAHGRMTGGVLAAIPAAVGLIMFAVNDYYPKFFLYDDLGRMMAGACLALQGIGFGVIRKIVHIEP